MAAVPAQMSMPSSRSGAADASRGPEVPNWPDVAVPTVDASRNRGESGPEAAFRAPSSGATRFGDDAIDIERAAAADDDLLPPPTVGGQLIDPESGMFAGPATKRLGRGGGREMATAAGAAWSCGGLPLRLFPLQGRA